jgi:citrate synthase
MLEEIRSKDNVPEFLDQVKQRKRKLFGFGHRIYKNYDPRAKIIRKIAYEVSVPKIFILHICCG